MVRFHEKVIDLLDNKEMEELQPVMNKELKVHNKEESIIQVALWEYSERILKLVGQNLHKSNDFIGKIVRFVYNIIEKRNFF